MCKILITDVMRIVIMENDDKQKKTVNIPQYYVMELKESKVHVLENEPKFCFSISAYCFGN